jgi:hypothetical protein
MTRTDKPAISAARLRRRGVVLWSAVAMVASLAAPPTASAQHLPPSAAAGQASQWTPRPPLRQARGGLQVVTVDGRILAIGGFENDRVFSLVEARSLTGSGTWHRLEPMSIARTNLAAVVLHGRVFAVGGFDSADSPLSDVEIFHPGTGHWTHGPSLPQPRGGAAAAVLNGRLYLAGGRDGSGAAPTGGRQRIPLCHRWTCGRPIASHGGTVRPTVEPMAGRHTDA